MKRTAYILTMLLVPLMIWAQKITVHGPTQIAAGEQFRLQYVVNTTDVKGFRLGNVPDAFEVLMGPSTSTQQSFQIINGHTSSTASVTYTYILLANKNGTFVIPSAHAVVNGNNVASQALKINVSGKAPAQQGQGGGMQQRQAARVDRAGARISGNDLFIKVSANKNSVYEQEPILLTYKVYTQVELTQLEGKMPDLNGFHTQEIPLPHQKTFHLETVNGKPYRCVTWSQYVMFPQMSGKLEIPSITFKGIVVQENTNVDPFEAFFNGGSGYVEVNKEIKAPSVAINVKPLPAKPANFSGGVGDFVITASLDKNKVKAGDPVSVRFVVSGTGNMKLIKEPEMALPKDFDKYDAKITDNTKLTPAGVTGNMVYDILIVPRNAGSYTIPAVDFVYFDTKTSAYKTLKTQPMALTVEKGSGKGGVTDYSQKADNDIHDIVKLSTVTEDGTDFFGSTEYMVTNIVALVTFIILFIIFRKRAMEMADIALMKGKKANKVAGKRLKKAAKLMAAGKSSDFYDEVLRALWGYVGDKLTMPVEALSRENIADTLSERNVDEDVIKSFIEAIDECEYARYAPGDPEGNMRKTYDKAVDAIMNIEEVVKKVKKHVTGKTTALGALVLMVMMLMPVEGNAASMSADDAYRQGNYNKAIELYEKEMKKGVSAEIYYNIGNAYFRSRHIPMAVVSYERAKKLAPMNNDIQHNLNIARSKTIDRMAPESEMFFKEWYFAIVNLCTVDAWAYTAVISLVVALLLFLIYLFVESMAVRRIAFYCSVALILVFLMSNLFAWQRDRMLNTHDTAIVMSEVVNVKSSPTQKSPDACVIHEGTWVRIIDNDIKGWYGIRLSDGREGWVPVKSLELI